MGDGPGQCMPMTCSDRQRSAQLGEGGRLEAAQLEANDSITPRRRLPWKPCTLKLTECPEGTVACQRQGRSRGVRSLRTWKL